MVGCFFLVLVKISINIKFKISLHVVHVLLVVPVLLVLHILLFFFFSGLLAYQFYWFTVLTFYDDFTSLYWFYLFHFFKNLFYRFFCKTDFFYITYSMIYLFGCLSGFSGFPTSLVLMDFPVLIISHVDMLSWFTCFQTWNLSKKNYTSTVFQVKILAERV